MTSGGDSPGVIALAKLLPGVDLKPVAELCAAARTYRYRGGQTVYPVNEPEHPGVVVSGLLRSVVTFRNGRRATIGYINPRGLFGLARLFCPLSTTVEAVRATEVIKIDAAVVARVASEYPKFGWFISQQVSLGYATVPRVVEELASQSVRQRLASHLLALAVVDDDGGLRVEVGQDDLAEAVCSVREVVSRALKSLREDAIIMKTGHSIVIIDERGLRRASH